MMAERRVSVRLSAIDGEKFRAELATIGQEGQQALEGIAGATAPVSGGLIKVDTATASLLRQLDALTAQAARASASLRQAGVDEVGAHAGNGGVPPEPPENGSASPVEIVLRNGRRVIVRSDIAPAALGRLLDVVEQ